MGAAQPCRPTKLVAAALKEFKTEGVGGEILQRMRQLMQDYETRSKRLAEVAKQLRLLAAAERHDRQGKPAADPRRDRGRD